MLNAEKYKKEILENSNVVSDFSMSKDKHVIKKCLGVCDDCFFHEAGDHCSNIKVKWLLSEYKEPVKLTRFEHDVLKYLLENTQYRFIARERNDTIYIYTRKPKKGSDAWEIISGMRNFNLFINLFPFIEWKDEEPKSIKKILNNCEVSDGES
ncbi:hypothetical protein [Catenibacterium sp.]|uniref:hypothetical protein n=1 Tax=Catenibacterium sp. TaxID=2049022 RepID=UPI004025D5D2